MRILRELNTSVWMKPTDFWTMPALNTHNDLSAFAAEGNPWSAIDE
jgi:hypothetical protein